jgi:hypothetical protein
MKDKVNVVEKIEIEEHHIKASDEIQRLYSQFQANHWDGHKKVGTIIKTVTLFEK